MLRYRRNPDATKNLFVTDINLDPPQVAKVSSLGVDPSEHHWDQRPAKDLSRHIVAMRSGKNKQNLLVLPGSTGRDMQLLRHYGVPSKKPVWEIIEKDVTQFRYLKESGILKRDSYHYHADNFNRLPLQDNKPFDFAWFDLFGNLNANDVQWFRNQFIVTPNLDLFFTFSFSSRGFKSALINVLRKTLDAWHPQLLNQTLLNLTPMSNFRSVHRSSALTRSPSMDQAMAIHWILLQYLFASHQFEIASWVYNDGDHQEMILYHLKNFRPRKEDPDHLKLVGSVGEILELLDSYRSNNSDDEIAKDLNLEEDRISQWRVINELPVSEAKYRLSQGLELLLNTDETPESKDYGAILCQAMGDFNPAAQTQCNYSKNKIKITSPKGEYEIIIGSEIQFQPGKTPTKISITPNFFHPSNRDGLFSILRILFRGDEYLHPQLCGEAYPDCFILSDPQKEAVRAWSSSVSMQEHAGMIVLPTGMGKTIVAAEIARTLPDGSRILFLAHRGEILRQAMSKFTQHAGYNPKDITRFYGNQEKTLKALKQPLVFATVASLSKSEHLKRLPPDTYDLVIVDEAHHVNAPTWTKIVEHFKKGAGYLLGLTATPFRTSGEKPAEMFEENYLYRKSLNRGIWEGYLSWPDYYLYDDNTNYSEILKKDHAVSDSIQRWKCFNPAYQKAVLEKYQLHAKGKKTIVFAPNIKSAKVMAEYFNQQGVASRYISHKYPSASRFEGERSERDILLDDFIAGKFQVLFSVSIFDEGVDIPDIGAIIKLNATESPLKIVQQLGRGLRLAPGKRDVVIIDFIGNYVTIESIFNLGNISGIGKRRILRTGVSRVEVQDDEEQPVFPETACQIEASVKVVLKNLIEDLAPEKIKPLIQNKIRRMCQEGYLPHDVAALYNVSADSVAQLCSGVASVIDTKVVERIRENLVIKKLLDSGGNPDYIVNTLLKNQFPKGWKEVKARIEELKGLKKHIEAFQSQGLSLEKIGSILKLKIDEIEDVVS